uniref:Uncharacterized protein n=1 Tax=Panagrolaimus sp. PS1159 TaxID=55785 RepID=A0AC35GNT2_9BILA
MPSTIKSLPTDSSTITTTTVLPLPILRHRHHRVRPPPPPPDSSSISDLIHGHNDTVLIPQTNFRKPQMENNNNNEKIKNTFAGGIFGRTSQPAGQSLASVFLLIFVLIGIVMILMLFYFLAKVCNGPDEERKGKIKTKNGKIIIQHPDKKNEKIEIIPTKVPYPKRIYELQAEEGYYSCPPSIHQSLQDIFGDGEDDFFAGSNTSNQSVGQRSRSMDDESETKKRQTSQSTPPSTQFVRKMTGAGLPPNFKAKGRLQQLQGS